ncbi:pyridoxamine 5'-phosphate oxidase family protein [Amycolatopsis minnesotensis]
MAAAHPEDVRLFTDEEIGFLLGHRVGRLATAGRSGKPHVVPVLYRFDAGRNSFGIGARELPGRGQDRLYLRHVAVNDQVAFVVDDFVSEPSWKPCGVTVKGVATVHAEGGELLGFGPRWLEIVPGWVSSWGVGTDPFRPAVPRKA